jgi:hypothetical protein
MIFMTNFNCRILGAFHFEKHHGLYFITIFFLNTCFFSGCRFSDSDKNEQWLNLNDSVQYVGMQTCRSCHADIYDTYILTGMGKSFDVATRQKSDAVFDKHAIVYDTLNDFYYLPYFKNDSLFIKEFRLEKNDTVHQRIEYVSYIIGSGNHTNSHLVNFNGFVYQAPITFYTQKQKWDMAPGFERGFNSRFSRIIAHECMTCHNGLPEFVSGSENLYKTVPNGIDCERCHGAGGLHVKEKLAGIIVDTSKQADYTIVNPRRLSKKLQMSLCQRCHLQGVSVLNEGRQFDHFKPGMNLGDVFHVFLPEFESKQNNFLMASQAERLRLSKCYLNSEMSCITCHNPHVSVKNTPKESFNGKCQSCHDENSKTPNHKCSLPIESRKENDCSGCHMPQSASIDIPHVSITDHYIRKENPDAGNQLPLEEIEKIQKFVQLKCYTDERPDVLLKAKAFLAFYEKFSSKEIYLDSVLFYLNNVTEKNKALESYVHYYFLKNDFGNIIRLAEKTNQQKINDSWTYYRIGEAFYRTQQFPEAIKWLEQATSKSPLNLDFQNKLGSAFFQAGNMSRAKTIYNNIISLQPKYKEAICNLGYIYMLENNFIEAKKLLEQAIALDPDYEQALLNKAILLYQMKNTAEAKKILNKILVKNPAHADAKKLLDVL